jgi:hypothetical protein
MRGPCGAQLANPAQCDRSCEPRISAEFETIGARFGHCVSPTLAQKPVSAYKITDAFVQVVGVGDFRITEIRRTTSFERGAILPGVGGENSAHVLEPHPLIS